MKYLRHKRIFYFENVISVCSFMTGFVSTPENMFTLLVFWVICFQLQLEQLAFICNSIPSPIFHVFSVIFDAVVISWDELFLSIIDISTCHITYLIT